MTYKTDGTHTTSTVVTDTQTGPTVPSTEMIQGGSIVGTIIALVHAFMWFRRKFSRDSMSIKDDNAHEKLVETLQEERDKAMKAAEEAWDTRAQDAKLIGGLTEKVNHLTAANDQLREEIHASRVEIQQMRVEIGELRSLVKQLLPRNLADAWEAQSIKSVDIPILMGAKDDVA